MKALAAVPPRPRRLGRRDLLKRAALAGVTASGAAGASGQPAEQSASPALTPQKGCLFIEAYSDQLSYAPGEEVAFHISTNVARYAIEVTRIGARDQPVWNRENLPGAEHPVPNEAAMHGCAWPVALRLPLPREWRSGYYRVELTGTHSNGERVKNESFFVLRAAQPGKNAKILLQLATNTYHA